MARVASIIVVLTASSLAACSHGGRNESGAVMRETYAATRHGMGDAVIAPLRVVRRLSCASQAESDLNAAVLAGTIRRAYLKGLGETHGCGSPAAPMRIREQQAAAAATAATAAAAQGTPVATAQASLPR